MVDFDSYNRCSFQNILEYIETYFETPNLTVNLVCNVNSIEIK